MVSIRALEKMLGPYDIGGAYSSSFTRYDEYRHEGVTVRVDELDFPPFGNKFPSYKQALENAARTLGLIPEKKS